MTETFNEDVLIDGSEDVTQLRVQGHSTQLEPLQNWEDAAGEPLARVTGSGKLQIGDLSLSTPAALIEASADLTSSSAKPNRGVHALGRFTGALADALTWAVHELELAGSGGISTLQTALRAKITNKNTGTVSSSQFRAGDFQAVNEKGGSGNAVEQITALRGAASNAANAHTAKAVGVEVVITNDSGGVLNQAVAVEVAPPNNSGTLQTLYGLRIADLNQGADNYAIYTGEGVVHLGDHQELRLESTAPTANPPGDFIKVYPKLIGDAPALFAKDSSGTETLIRGIDNNALHTNGVGEITTLSEKTTPHADDIFVIEDSEDSHTKKRMRASNLLGNDENALHTNEAGEIAALSEKTAPHADDWLLIEDNEDSHNKKKLRLSNLSLGSGASGGGLRLHNQVYGFSVGNTTDAENLIISDRGLVVEEDIPADTFSARSIMVLEAAGYVTASGENSVDIWVGLNGFQHFFTTLNPPNDVPLNWRWVAKVTLAFQSYDLALYPFGFGTIQFFDSNDGDKPVMLLCMNPIGFDEVDGGATSTLGFYAQWSGTDTDDDFSLEWSHSHLTDPA